MYGIWVPELVSNISFDFILRLTQIVFGNRGIGAAAGGFA